MEKEEELEPRLVRMSISESSPAPDPAPSSVLSGLSNPQSTPFNHVNNNGGHRGSNKNKKKVVFKGLSKELGEFVYACSHEDPDNKLDIRKTNEAVMFMWQQK